MNGDSPQRAPDFTLVVLNDECLPELAMVVAATPAAGLQARGSETVGVAATEAGSRSEVPPGE